MHPLTINRRTFLSGLAAGAATPLVFGQAGVKPFVESDIGPLVRVLVHTPGPEIRKGLGLTGAGSGHPFASGGFVADAAIDEHREFVRLMKAANAEVLEIESVLDGAVEAARSKGRLHSWLRDVAPQLASRERDISGAALLGAADEFAYARDTEGAFWPLTESLRSMVYTRDSVAMTPRGAILCNFLNLGRSFESTLMRFAFDWSPELKKYPVVFDAAEEQMSIEGGDVMVLDGNTLLLGVGNRTNPAIARLLAMRLGMDVLAVQMPTGSAKRWNDPATRTPLHSALLHLDTIFTLVDTRTALTLPFFLEGRYAGRDPLTEMLRSMAMQPNGNEGDLGKMIAALKDVGRLKLYKAGSGNPDRSVDEMKLVDFMRSRGYRIVFVGGGPPEVVTPKYIAESVMRDLRFQAANVLATHPGEIIAYAGNEHTLEPLRSAGIQVKTFPGGELMRTNGGPHCMSMPLERRA